MIGRAETSRALRPDHLALCSWLHGGPRPLLTGARILEIGGDWGFHSLVLARCDRSGTYVGVASSPSAVAAASATARRLGITNAHFFARDWAASEGWEELADPFDYVLAPLAFARLRSEHWGSLLGFCRSMLRRDGLLYIDYKTRPGWTVRCLVNELLAPPTEQISDPAARHREARQLAESLRDALPRAAEHAYQRLIATELDRFIVASEASVHGEYFAADPPIDCGELFALAQEQGLVHLADADFNSPASRFVQTIDVALADFGFPLVERQQLGDLLINRVRRRSVLCRNDCKRRPVLKAKDSRRLLVAVASEAAVADSINSPDTAPDTAEDRADPLHTAILAAVDTTRGHDPLPFDDFRERVAALLQRRDPAAQLKPLQLFSQLLALYRDGALELFLKSPALPFATALQEVAELDLGNGSS